MNDRIFKYGELGRLIARQIDGEITEEEHRRLESMLLDDPHAQAFYRDYLAVDSELVWSFDAESATTHALVVDTIDEADLDELFAPRPVRRRWLVPTALFAAVTAAIAVIVFALSRPRHSPSPTPTSATYAQIVELVGSAEVLTAAGEVLEASVGQELAVGQTLRVGHESSFAIVEYADHTRLELLADTVVRLATGPTAAASSAGKQVFVSRGLVRADVMRQPAGQPMLLQTPHAEIHILGTTFISAIDPAGTRVEMEKGRVEVVRQADGQTIEVDSGTFVEATADPALKPMVARPLPSLIHRPLNVLNTYARDLAYSDDGSQIAFAWKDRVWLWDAKTWTRQRTLQSKHEDIRSVRFIENQMGLMTLGKKPQILRWLLPEGRRTANYQHPRKVFTSTMHIAPGGRAVVWADPAPNRTCDFKMWESDVDETRLIGISPVRDLHCLALSPDWKTLVAGSRRGKLVFLTPGQTEPGSVEQAHRKQVRVLQFSPDGQWLASGSEDGDVKIWNVATRQMVQRLEGQGRQIVSLAFSPDGSLLATGRNDGTVKLWNPMTAQERTTIAHSRRGEVRCLAFSPDGRTLITAIPGRPILVWDLLDDVG